LFRPRCWKAFKRKKISEMKFGVVLSTKDQLATALSLVGIPSIDVYSSTSSFVALIRVSSLILMRELFR
jgi:hypothetical protein